MTKFFNLRFFIVIFFTLIITTILMILIHEIGHYLFGILVGNDMAIGFDSAHAINPDSRKIIDWDDYTWVSFGGPFFSYLIGTIGFILLFIYRKSFVKIERLLFKQWILVLLSLFWFRGIMVGVLDVINYFFIGDVYFSDEKSLSLDLHLPLLFLSILTGFIAITIFTTVILKFIPKKQRIIFTIASIIGFIAGNYLWLGFLGEILIP